MASLRDLQVALLIGLGSHGARAGRAHAQHLLARGQQQSGTKIFAFNIYVNFNLPTVNLYFSVSSKTSSDGNSSSCSSSSVRRKCSRENWRRPGTGMSTRAAGRTRRRRPASARRPPHLPPLPLPPPPLRPRWRQRRPATPFRNPSSTAAAASPLHSDLKYSKSYVRSLHDDR